MEAPLVIKAEGLTKRYRLGQAGGGTLSEDLAAWFSRVRGKGDPRDTLDPGKDSQQSGKDFWALRGVDFELHKGEVLGIIGRNGAGKSTLLKLLSRITLPTEGTIGMRGRVSSLLEVGTGFNPELSGRENIYLNGAILGMRKAEIDRKLQEIIGFSGIKHHIDSPVKRYSSGMKVRLGFAVAAHLEPEILIIDEVLAVGDADFQRKCLGKMREVARSERTILFVSHNMTAVRSLCTRVIWLKDGRVHMSGPTSEVVNAYLSSYTELRSEKTWSAEEAPGNEIVRLRSVSIEAEDPAAPITWTDPFSVRLGFDNLGVDDNDINFVIWLFNNEDVHVFTSGWRESAPEAPVKPGANMLRCHIPGQLLNTGEYRLVVLAFRAGKRLFTEEDTVAFEVHEPKREGTWFGKRKGVVRPLLQWDIEA